VSDAGHDAPPQPPGYGSGFARPDGSAPDGGQTPPAPPAYPPPAGPPPPPGQFAPGPYGPAPPAGPQSAPPGGWQHLGSPPRGPDYLPRPDQGAPDDHTRAFAAPPQQARNPRSLLLLALVIGLLGGLVGGAVGVAYERGQGQSTAAGRLPSGPLLGTGAPTPVDPNPSSVSSIAARLLPSVVTISVTGTGESGTGSGVIIRPDGFILTNNHVVAVAAGGGTVTVDLYKGQHNVAARIIGTDPKTDLAVIRIPGSNLPAATLGQSKSLVVGAPVVAMGSPLGLSSTVTSGIISALDRNVEVPTDGGGSGVLIGAIQTDAAINPGNSGGPLVDSQGQVIGINSAIASAPGTAGAGGNIGVGFAIPIDYARSVAEEIIRTGKATHPYLGITAVSIDPATGTQPGARIRSIVPGGPADVAKLQVGDLITKVNDTTIEGVDDLVAATRLHKIGDVVTVTYQRGSTSATVPVTLQESKG
jgi:putative serine protease PepD